MVDAAGRISQGDDVRTGSDSDGDLMRESVEIQSLSLPVLSQLWTRNSGVTIAGEKKPAAVLNSLTRACFRTLAI